MIGNHLERYTVKRVNHGLTSRLDAEQLGEFLDPRSDRPRRPATGERLVDVGRLAAWVSRLQGGGKGITDYSGRPAKWLKTIFHQTPHSTHLLLLLLAIVQGSPSVR